MTAPPSLRAKTLPLGRRLASACLAGAARAVTGVRAIRLAPEPPHAPQRIYFANHCSHGDFILLSACLEPEERMRTRAVAAADYWGKTKLRRFVAETLLFSVLIERQGDKVAPDAVAVMLDVLASGASLIIFPEGTRNTGDAPLQRFRSGLYNLALARPDLPLVPAWIENMARVLPKGHFLPVPLLCRVVFGAPVSLGEGEERRLFLDRAHAALLALDPGARRERGR